MTIGMNLPVQRGYHHGDLRRTLLRIAREEVEKHGAAQLSLTAIARLASVSQAAPYRHFADIRNLLEALAAEGFQEIFAAVAQAAAKARRTSKLRAMMIGYVRYAEANIELYRLMFASRMVPDAEPGSAVQLAAESTFIQLKETLAETLPAGAVDDEAILIWSRLHGLVMLKADGFIKSRLERYVGKIPALHAPGAPRRSAPARLRPGQGAGSSLPGR